MLSDSLAVSYTYVENLGVLLIALERLGNKEYDVILLDIKLPGMSDIDIHQQLQKSSKSLTLTRKIIFRLYSDFMSSNCPISPDDSQL